MKKILLVAVAGLVLSGCYHIAKTAPVSQEAKTKPGAAETQEPQAVENKNTLVYDDSGFTPKAMTVGVGTIVTWRNTGNKMMRVASAIHPTHQELPGFDQLEATGNGTTYGYTFIKAGTWRYHNHVSPGDTGMVIVEE